MEALFGIIWLVVLIAIFSKASKTIKGRGQRPPQAGTRPAATQRPVGLYAQGNANRPRPLGAIKNTAQDSSSGDSFNEASRAYSMGKIKASRLSETGVLLEDRKNDWLAKQLREEAAILKRGSLYDLGAAHDVDCDADRIKRQHLRVHNSNGLDRRTFR